MPCFERSRVRSRANGTMYAKGGFNAANEWGANDEVRSQIAQIGQHGGVRRNA